MQTALPGILDITHKPSGITPEELEGDVEKLFKSLQEQASNLPQMEPPDVIGTENKHIILLQLINQYPF